MAIAALTLFWCIAFRSLYFNPWSYATSEHLAHYFTCWRWFGKTLRTGTIPRDPYYYPSLSGHPITSVWYPWHWISSFIGSFLSLNTSFIFYTTSVLLHYLFASVCAYFLFESHGPLIAIFCSLAFTYAQSYIRTGACQIYATSWIPAVLLLLDTGHPLLAGLAATMVAAGGYPGVLIYTLPVFLWQAGSSWPVFLGAFTLFVLPQAIVTARYMRTTNRASQDYTARAIGSLPLWHILTQPILNTRLNLNGVLYPETSIGVGRVALLLAMCAGPSPWWLVVAGAVYLMLGRYAHAPIPLRVAARAGYLLPIALTYLAASGLTNLALPHELLVILFLLHAWDIIANHIPNILFHPFMEPNGPPSRQFNTPLTRYLSKHLGGQRVSGLPHPLYTGHINRMRTLGYCAGCAPRWMRKLRNDTDPNGSGAHDWFTLSPDNARLTWYGVKYAYTRTGNPGGWHTTPIPHLYRNPREIPTPPPDWHTCKQQIQ